MEKTAILSASDIEIRTERIAFQILEDHYNEEHLFLVGILPNGKSFAEDLSRYIKKEIPTITCTLVTALTSNKNSSDASVEFSIDIQEFKGKSVIIIDDVLNSGKTMAAVLKEVFKMSPKRVKTAVMVERAYKDFPITANYKGLEINTNIKDHIEVHLTEPKSAWLI